jgi:hypothetical protein
MKGMIFNQLENMVTEQLGPETWEQLLTQTTLSTADGVFIGPKNYPDEDLFALVGTASRLTGAPADALVRGFGRYLFPKLAELYPVFFKGQATAKSFLMSVDRIIHVEIRKLDSNAGLPMMDYEDAAPDQLVLVYRSPRNLCELALGLIEGVGAHFGEQIALAETSCRKQGAEACRIECTFAKA